MNKKMKLLTIVLVVAISTGIFVATASAWGPEPPKINGIMIGQTPPDQSMIVPLGTVYLDTAKGELWQYTTKAQPVGGAMWYTTGWVTIYVFNK